MSDKAAWLMSTGDQPTVGGFLYATLASVGLGMTVSAVRWLIVDKVHHHTGVVQQDSDFRKLRSTVGAYLMLVEFHYRYYQFYANTLVAVLLAYPMYRFTSPIEPAPVATDFLILIAIFVYIVASRDSLRKYYERVSELLDDNPK